MASTYLRHHDERFLVDSSHPACNTTRPSSGGCYRTARLCFCLRDFSFPTDCDNDYAMTEQLGRAMIRVARDGAPKHVLENHDLLALAE